MRALRLAAAALALAFLATGCARVLDTQVSSISDLPEGRLGGATISIIGANEDIAESLLFRKARSRIAAEFRARGMVVVPNGSEPRYVAVTDYRMDEGETTVRAGDIIVQRGTNHGWANRSDRNCRICFVLIDGEFDAELKG